MGPFINDVTWSHKLFSQLPLIYVFLRLSAEIYAVSNFRGGLGRFFTGLGWAVSQKIGPGLSWAILLSTKTGPGQNGPIFLAIIDPKWANLVSFLDQNKEVEITMSLILHLNTGKINMNFL